MTLQPTHRNALHPSHGLGGVHYEPHDGVAMTVLIVEDNLFWSARLRQSVLALGAHPEVSPPAPVDADPAPAIAIVNLGGRRYSADAVIRSLKARGVRVIGHAGHKETELLEIGRQAGCDDVVTNGSLTFHLPKILGLEWPEGSDPNSVLACGSDEAHDQ